MAAGSSFGRPTLGELVATVASDLDCMLWAEGLWSRATEPLDDTLVDLLETMPHGVLITDLEGIIQYANLAMARLSGYSQDSLVGQSPRILKSEAHDPACYRALWQSLASGQVWRGTLIDQRIDSVRFVAETAIYPLSGPTRQAVAYAALYRDVTEQRQQTVLNAMALVSGHIAHDLNNLLTVLSVYSQMLLEDLGPGSRPFEEAVRINRAVHRITGLSKNLGLVGTRGSADQGPLEINGFLGEMAPILLELLGASIHFSLDLAPQPLNIKGSTEQLEVLLTNLAVNSRAAMPDGGLFRIATRVGTKGKGGINAPLGYAQIIITDTGTGLPADMVDHLFEPFYTHRRGGVGTGLSLAVARGITKAHGGQIRLDQSTDGETRFCISLPLLHTTPVELES